MKKRISNLVILLVGASVFLTAHFYQSDTDQVSVKQTIFPGKQNYLYVPDYPAAKRPGYRSGTSWYYRDYSGYKTDSTPLFDKTIVAVYDVTNKTKNYLLVPVTIAYETASVSAASPSYSLVGAVTNIKYSLVEYFLLDPKETLKGMYTLSTPPLSFTVTPEVATVVEKKWVQGLQQALDGDVKKLQQYLQDTLALPASVRLKQKLSEALQPDLVKNVTAQFTSWRQTGYGYPEITFQLENKNDYALETTVSVDCFDKSFYASVSAGQNRSVTVGLSNKPGCDTISPKLTVTKVKITGVKN